MVANVTALFCCGPWGTLASSQSDAVEYFKKNLIKKHIYFRMLPDLVCAGPVSYIRPQDAIRTCLCPFGYVASWIALPTCE